METSENANIDKLKKIELGILSEVISICHKLDIKYYILGGTLLGAVRHGGFIPWDDDIDIGMFRQDYFRFVMDAPKYLSEHLFLQTHETDPNYFNGYAKVRNSNTAFVEKVCKDSKMNHGIFIDIFPLDFVHRKNNLLFEIRKKMPNERICAEFYPNEYHSIIGKLAIKCAKWCYPSVEQAYQKREKLYIAYQKEGAYIANHNGAWGKKEIVPAQWYGEGTLMEFEGLQVLAPKEYDQWLTQVYGDYRKLPPVEQRVTHHNTIVIDTEKSYRYYVNE